MKSMGEALSRLSVADVSSLLSQMHAVPQRGVVAGQAVASAVMEMLGVGTSGKRPMNDLDVFVTSNGMWNGIHDPGFGERRSAAQKRGSSMAHHSSAVGVRMEGRGGYEMMNVFSKNGYDIDFTERDGLLNTVWISPRQWTAVGVDDPALIIGGFDLNCVQVGFDASGGGLVWTPAFESFLETMQMEVCNVATPFHTAVRWFSKKTALGCYGNDALAMTACAIPSGVGALDPNDGWGTGLSSAAVGRFGSKVAKAYDEEALALSKWFAKKKAQGSNRFWTMEPVFSENEALLSKARELSALVSDGSFKERSDIATRLLGPVAGRLVDGVHGPSNDVTDALIMSAPSIARRMVLGVSPSARKREEEFAGMTAKAPAAARFFFGARDLLSGSRWMGRQDVSEEDAALVGGMLGGHCGLMGLFDDSAFKEQAQMTRALRKLESEHGEKAVGWIEALVSDGADGEKRARALLSDETAMADYAKEMSKGAERRLNSPFEFDKASALARRAAERLLGVRIEELLTPGGLEQEGRQMSHCVGGYAGAIEKGRARIFKVEGLSKKDRSTAEVRLAAKGMEVAQHRGFANAATGAAAGAAVRMVAESYGASRKGVVYAMGKRVAGAAVMGAVPKGRERAASSLIRKAAALAAEMPNRRESIEMMERALGVLSGAVEPYPSDDATSGSAMDI